MRASLARNIIEKNNLVPGAASREILDAIINDLPFEYRFSQYGVSSGKFNELKKEYKKTLDKLSKNEAPRYLPFYYMAKRRVPTLQWYIVHKQDQTLVKWNAPRIDNIRLSLLSLLLKKINAKEDTWVNRRYPCLNIPFDVSEVLSSFIKNAQILYPNKNTMRAIIDWIRKARRGDQTTVFFPICPDYSVVPTGDPVCPYKHTFDGVGEGIGPVAERILKALPEIISFFNAVNIKPRLIAGIADFECFSQENQERVGLDERFFLRKVNKSRVAFERRSKIKTDMISEFIGGKKQWLDYRKHLYNQFDKKDYGCANIDDKLLLEIARNRRALYERWYGNKGCLINYVPTVLSQGIDYAIMGSYIANQWKNCLILGADSSVFLPFYDVVKCMPKLYFKKYYC